MIMFRPMKAAIAIATALSLLTFPAAAQQYSGNEYLELCEQSEAGLQNGCAGYSVGLMSALFFWNGIEPAQGGPSLKFCPPTTALDGQQVRDLFVGFIDRHPEHRNYAAGMSAFLALLEAWPCE